MRQIGRDTTLKRKIVDHVGTETHHCLLDPIRVGIGFPYFLLRDLQVQLHVSSEWISHLFTYLFVLTAFLQRELQSPYRYVGRWKGKDSAEIVSGMVGAV